MEQKLRRDRNIGSNLKALREKHNISQEKLCALLQRAAVILDAPLMPNMKMAN